MTEIQKIWNKKTVRIRKEDRYVCLTDIAKASGKKLNDWSRQESTSEYLQALEQVTGIPATQLIEVQNGKPTYAHPKVALRFAQWCSPRLAVQVDFWIDELLTEGKIEINPKTKNELEEQLIRTGVNALKTVFEDLDLNKHVFAGLKPHHS